MRKIIVFIFIIAAVLCFAVVLSSCETQEDEEIFAYTLLPDGTYGVRVSMRNSLEEIVFPSTHQGKAVTSILSPAIILCSKLARITIPDSITSIATHAFSDCMSLAEITVDTENEYYCSIDGVLYDKNATTLIFFPYQKNTPTIPNSVTSIGDYAFANCTSLTDISIPDSVTSIGDSAFADCINLANVTLPNTIAHIGSEAFNGCHMVIKTLNGISYVANAVIGFDKSAPSAEIREGTTIIADMAFYDCANLTSVTIPNSVTAIGEFAFYKGINLTSITLPDSITTIERRAFAGCRSLESMSIPAGVTSLGVGVFDGCSMLSEITVSAENEYYCSIDNILYDKNVTTLFFSPSEKTDVTIPDTVTRIEEDAFSNCHRLKNIVIPESITSIGNSAFFYCSALTNITIPASVTSIGVSAFSLNTSLVGFTVADESEYFCQIDGILYDKSATMLICCPSTKTEITIPDSVTTIASGALEYCENLTTVTIPDSVTSIELGAFSSCKGLESITIPNSVTDIASLAFFGCNNLTSVTIPASLTTLSEEVFFQCEKLKSIHFNGTKEQWAKLSPKNDFTNCTIYCTDGNINE